MSKVQSDGTNFWSDKSPFQVVTRMPDIYYVQKQLGEISGDAEKVLKSVLRKLNKDYLKPEIKKAVTEKYALTEEELSQVDRARYSSMMIGWALHLKIRSHREALSKFGRPGSAGLDFNRNFHKDWQRGLNPKSVNEEGGERPVGVDVMVKKGEYKTNPKTFYAKMPGSGHVGIFKRVGGIAKTGNAKIKQLMTISVSEMMMASFDINEHGGEIYEFMKMEIDKKAKEAIRKYNREKAKREAAQ